MKKRIFALITAVLMLFCMTVPSFALVLQTLDIAVSPIDPNATTIAYSASEKFRMAMHSVMQTLSKYLALIIVLVIIIAVVVIVTVSEKKLQKEREAKQPPKKKKKNEK